MSELSDYCWLFVQFMVALWPIWIAFGIPLLVEGLVSVKDRRAVASLPPFSTEALVAVSVSCSKGGRP